MADDPTDFAGSGQPAQVSGYRPMNVLQIVIAAGLALSSAWMLLSEYDAITAGNPAYLVTLLGAIVVALSLVALGARPRRRERHASARWVRVTSTVVQVGFTVLVVVVLFWLRPLPAEPTAVAAMTSGNGVAVASTASSITLTPTGAPTHVGLVFYPGALVDPRAYVPLLRPLVVAGNTVVVVKEPFGLAFFSPRAPNAIYSAHPDVRTWAVGGHSLGGVVAAAFANGNEQPTDGLLFWASYPASDMSSNTRLDITSVSGSEDGLATPAKIEQSKRDLPPTTIFVVVQGANHATFGDYGSQRGDNPATVPKSEAQAQITDASEALLQRLAAAK